MNSSAIWVFLMSTLTLSSPLILAAMGGLLSERTGVINIALEGKMLGAAVTTAILAANTGNAWLGLAGGLAAGVLLSLLHWLMTQLYRIDQIISGMAINAIAIGGSNYLSLKFLDPDRTAELPVVSPNLLYVVTFLAPVGLAFYMARMRGGLRVLAVGEDPDKSRQVGLEPVAIRLRGLMATGLLCGLAGVLFVSQSGRFVDNMTSGWGFIALAGLILGGWRPLPATIACLAFGGFQAMQIQLMGTKVFGANLPPELWQSLPYLATIVALAGFMGGRSRAPAGLGKA